MAFLDNSGDIILDAVLTDAGRQRMAEGNFRIVKFALGDEEINYTIFNADHPSGSAFYDLSIMQTPVLEAFTNNTSLMKTKLVSINRNNILFMPILAPNTKTHTPVFGPNVGNIQSYGGYFVLADEYTAKNGNLEQDLAFQDVKGVIMGHDQESEDFILIDQAINGDGDLNIKTPFPTDLIETAYMVKVDHRLLRLDGKTNLFLSPNFTKIDHSFVDDDGIATYYIAQGDPGFINEVDRHVGLDDNAVEAFRTREVFSGPLGTRLAIAPRSSLNVRQSQGLFNEIGSTSAAQSLGGGPGEGAAKDLGAHKFIDTIINVVGVTTGYSLDIPVRILRKNR